MVDVPTMNEHIALSGQLASLRAQHDADLALIEELQTQLANVRQRVQSLEDYHDGGEDPTDSELPPPEPPIEPPDVPPSPNTPPVNEAIRRAALLALPPDSERDFRPITDLGQLTNLHNGETIAFPLGKVFHERWNITGHYNITMTVYGDRDKPWPVFKDAGALTASGCRSCLFEFLEATGGNGHLFMARDCLDFRYRYCYGHHGGRMLGNTPGAGNVGVAFRQEGACDDFEFWYCETHDMSEDGIQPKVDVRGSILVKHNFHHNNIEDGIDIKGGRVTIEDTWLLDNRSKNITCHGNADGLRVKNSRIVGTILHDSIWIDGLADSYILAKGTEPIIIENTQLGGAKLRGIDVKRTRRDVILRNIDWVPSGEENYRSATGHTGRIIVE